MPNKDQVETKATIKTRTVFSGVTLGQDRTSSIVDKSGRNNVAIDITLTEGAAAFDASGEILVLAGNTSTLVESDQLSTPKATVSAAGKLKFQLTTAYPYIALFYNYSSGGADDEIDATITVSN